MVTKKSLRGCIRSCSDKSVSRSQNVLAGAKACDDDALLVFADKDAGRPEVPVHDSTDGASIGICHLDAMEIGEGIGDLLHDREDHFVGNVNIHPFVLSDEPIKRTAVAVHGHVDKAPVLNDLVASEDPGCESLRRAASSDLKMLTIPSSWSSIWISFIAKLG